MKVDFVKSLIALGISALVAYGLYSLCDVESLRWLLALVEGAMLTLLSVFTLGVSAEKERTSIVLKVLSGTMFAVVAVVNFIFAFCDFNKPLFVIVNGLCLLLYALVAVSVYRKQQ